MKICRTCAHWTPPDERGDFLSGPLQVDWEDGEQWEAYEARAQARNGGYGLCAGILFFDDVEGDAVPLAVCQDGSGYKASVVTQGEFSCALWSAPGVSPAPDIHR